MPAIPVDISTGISKSQSPEAYAELEQAFEGVKDLVSTDALKLVQDGEITTSDVNSVLGSAHAPEDRYDLDDYQTLKKSQIACASAAPNATGFANLSQVLAKYGYRTTAETAECNNKSGEFLTNNAKCTDQVLQNIIDDTKCPTVEIPAIPVPIF